MKKIILPFLVLFLIAGNLLSQEKLTYQKPPQEILELVDAPLAPSVLIDSKGENAILLYRDAFKSIAELSETEMRLAGLRINPVTNIGSRTTYYNNIKVKKTNAATATQVVGLPENARLSYFNRSPNEKMVACLNTTEKGVEVWIVDIEKATTKRLTEANVNANMRDAINWFSDNNALLVKFLPADRKALINTAEAVPEGPTISRSDGEKAQNRTYQDLLKNPNDEANFEQLDRSEIKKVSIQCSLITEAFQESFFPPATLSPWWEERNPRRACQPASRC